MTKTGVWLFFVLVVALGFLLTLLAGCASPGGPDLPDVVYSEPAV